MKKILSGALTPLLVIIGLLAAQGLIHEARAELQPDEAREMLDSEIAKSVGSGFEYADSDECRSEAQDFAAQSTESLIITSRCTKESAFESIPKTIMSTRIILLDTSATIGQRFYQTKGAKLTIGPATDPDSEERCAREAAHLDALSTSKLSIEARCSEEPTGNQMPGQIVLQTKVTITK